LLSEVRSWYNISYVVEVGEPGDDTGIRSGRLSVEELVERAFPTASDGFMRKSRVAAMDWSDGPGASTGTPMAARLAAEPIQRLWGVSLFLSNLAMLSIPTITLAPGSIIAPTEE
jgi:hypothetical protein